MNVYKITDKFSDVIKTSFIEKQGYSQYNEKVQSTGIKKWFHCSWISYANCVIVWSVIDYFITKILNENWYLWFDQISAGISFIGIQQLWFCN